MTGFVSSYTIQSSMRMTIQRAQSEIQNLQTEVVTGRHADIGEELGAQTSNAVMLHRDFEEFSTIKDTNALVTNRLSASQSALTLAADNAQNTVESLIISQGSADQKVLSIAVAKITSGLDAFTGALNLSSNGEYLFSGIDTENPPLNDYFEAGSLAKTAFDSAFLTYFGFTQADPGAQSITETQMTDFIENTIEPMYLGANWATDWSSASDVNITSRISRSELIESSTNANEDAFRNFALGSVVALEMLDINFSPAAREVVTKKALDYVGQAVSGIDLERAKLGISEARIEKSNTTLQVQADLSTIYVSQLEEVDVYEASTRVNALLAQVETSYSITSRIQRLNLIDYL